MLLASAILSGFLVSGSDKKTAIAARDNADRAIACLELPESGHFSISYQHSYYDAPAVEKFIANGTTFRLVEISSVNEGVLDYYELEGERKSSGAWFSLLPDERRRFDSLPLIATEKGRRTIVVSGEKQPLYGEDDARHLTLEIEDGGCLNWPWR